MKKVSPVKAKVIGVILQVIGFIVFAIGTIAENVLIQVIGVALVFDGLIYEIKYFRCPNCGKPLGRGNSSGFHMPGFCRYCGRQYTGFAEPPEQKPKEVDDEPWKKFK